MGHAKGKNVVQAKTVHFLLVSILFIHNKPNLGLQIVILLSSCLATVASSATASWRRLLYLCPLWQTLT